MEQWNKYETKLRYLRTRGKNALLTEILINIPYKIYEVRKHYKDYSSWQRSITGKIDIRLKYW